MSNGGQQQQQRSTYVESHAIAHAALQQHMAQQAAQARLAGPGPPAPQPPNPTFTVPDDGLGYDDGVRVLRTIGSWCVKYTIFNIFQTISFCKQRLRRRKFFHLKKHILLYNIFNIKILFC